MTKRKRLTTKKTIENLIKEGRGEGIGEDYKPWILIQDVASLGRATRLKGIKTNRQHEFLSDLERNYFYILEYSDTVIDIREQFPLLPLEETVLIAKELGIEHPTDPKTNEPIVMTTDFLITTSKNEKLIDVARTIKYKDDLMNKRILEKFEIERIYWERREINWGIVTEEEINKNLAQNISYIHSYYNIEDIDSLKNIEKYDIEDLVMEYARRLIDETVIIREISNKFDDDLLLQRGTGISLFKYLLIRKAIQIDLYTPIDVNEKIKVNLVTEELDKECKIS
ncbi:TnsA endonuclease N-terminal domain-containing protein [uncultured Tissierella sp.]|uniref:TnsA endonuclease N-terminal domain-containing protein n=1 Tax=uncultured Tissierella sp. TaxID=448160 RepID=UPI002803C795|nr:TnsA endonuclease N-terminal domain-containing protein [uncultured Tissierella sp.]MDU5080986.1 TnsA endonuclease N-terminal domain-containing protein [Bacillota bacterium]